MFLLFQVVVVSLFFRLCCCCGLLCVLLFSGGQFLFVCLFGVTTPASGKADLPTRQRRLRPHLTSSCVSEYFDLISVLSSTLCNGESLYRAFVVTGRVS